MHRSFAQRAHFYFTYILIITYQVVAFVPMRSVFSLLSSSMPSHHLQSNIQFTSMHGTNSIAMLPASFEILPSLLTSDEILEYQAANAFEDTVSLDDLASDPFIQGAFVVTAIAIMALFIAKTIVTQMDDAVQKTAIDFDRVMTSKYPKKWVDFIEMEQEIVGVVDREQREGDRIQNIVEEMERLTKEEPEFFEKVMRDVERQI